MRNLYFHIIIVLSCVLISSCATTTRISVEAKPGTQILSNDFKVLAVANSSGVATFENADSDYRGILFSRDSESSACIPFVLDYEHHQYGAATTAKIAAVGYGAGAVASVACAIGGAAGTPIVAVPLGIMMSGLAGFFPPFFRSMQDTHDYQYRYLPVQRTNQDCTFVPLSMPAEKPASSISTKALASSSSTKSFKTRLAEGVYVGSGTLSKDGFTVEEYIDIQVKVSKQSETVALVNVIESNGSKFFGEDLRYSIKRNPSGAFALTLTGISAATISISAAGKMEFTHPRIEIDGDIYGLSICAELQK